MTTFKMPDHLSATACETTVIRGGKPTITVPAGTKLYTAEAVHEAMRDALEQAARVVDDMVTEAKSNFESSDIINYYSGKANEIRSMKEQIK